MMMMAHVGGQKRRSFDGFPLTCIGTPVSGCGSNGKRLKSQVDTSGGEKSTSTKEKDKIGKRIAALQQLVSPYGKTDTASVLHEATGYIKFLHDQLQVLSAPYLQTPTMENTQELVQHNLRSRGLCLMPVSSTLRIARSNGADMWAPMNTSKHF